MSHGEEYQVVKKGREHYGCGEEYNTEIRERGSNIIFPIKLRLLGRISSGEEGKMISDEFFFAFNRSSFRSEEDRN